MTQPKTIKKVMNNILDSPRWLSRYMATAKMAAAHMEECDDCCVHSVGNSHNAGKYRQLCLEETS